MDISEGFSLLIFSISAKKKTFAENLYLPYLANPKTFLENTFFILKPPLKDMVNNTPRDNCRKWIFLKALAF